MTATEHDAVLKPHHQLNSTLQWQKKYRTWTHKWTDRHFSPVLISQARIRPLLCPVIITTSCVPIRRYRTDVDARRFTSGVVMRQNTIEWTKHPTLIVSTSSFSRPHPLRTELCNITTISSPQSQWKFALKQHKPFRSAPSQQNLNSVLAVW